MSRSCVQRPASADGNPGRFGRGEELRRRVVLRPGHDRRQEQSGCNQEGSEDSSAASGPCPFDCRDRCRLFASWTATRPSRYASVVTHPEPAPSPSLVVVMPAYNAAETLRDTVRRIPANIDRVILVDDGSQDETVAIAQSLGLKVICHPHNVGYGGNQKTCYTEALRDGADVVVMLHPDGQYDPELITDLIRPIVEGRADMVLGSRFLPPVRVEECGMPRWKIVCHRRVNCSWKL